MTFYHLHLAHPTCVIFIYRLNEFIIYLQLIILNKNRFIDLADGYKSIKLNDN